MDDLISRQQAIDLFPNDVLEWDTLDGYIAPHVARRLIEDLPSAQPEPIKINIDHELTKDDYEKLRKDCADAPIVLLPECKKGRWIEMGQNEDGTHNICCGVCGKFKIKSRGHANSAYTKSKYRFCGGCGARMDEADNE